MRNYKWTLSILYDFLNYIYLCPYFCNCLISVPRLKKVYGTKNRVISWTTCEVYKRSSIQLPEIKDENMRGRIIIFNTCMKISPGKLISWRVSWRKNKGKIIRALFKFSYLPGLNWVVWGRILAKRQELRWAVCPQGEGSPCRTR